MILILTVLLAVTVGAAIAQFKGDGYSIGWGVLAAVTGFVWLIVLMFAIKWQPSSDTLTGYIYQRNNRYGYANYSLRFSQNAGMDEQPSFCVRAGSVEDNKLKDFVGKEVKVQVAIPSRGFRIVNNPFECSSYAVLEEVLE